jgi:hypothetical protein
MLRHLLDIEGQFGVSEETGNIERSGFAPERAPIWPNQPTFGVKLGIDQSKGISVVLAVRPFPDQMVYPQHRIAGWDG